MNNKGMTRLRNEEIKCRKWGGIVYKFINEFYL
jgi:hypothetical protein